MIKRNLTIEEIIARPQRALDIIEALKRHALYYAGPDYRCQICKKIPTGSSACSGAHQCPDCFYFPYIEGLYVGCNCSTKVGKA